MCVPPASRGALFSQHVSACWSFLQLGPGECLSAGRSASVKARKLMEARGTVYFAPLLRARAEKEALVGIVEASQAGGRFRRYPLG